ncbi:ABC transporter permease subunit [Actinomadura barringtoniae]|uniref:ABC transporter permease subunit n=1 Tax=Actinomadura barringtoniae TaxID=1427535 RepID=A0A939PI78_9ACTN|nr:ABC transporter permease subunit [Actinomadura barringtoniae]MBO2449011.1 ABC transporter permease subunit [Actinomadura barringtoniae]
MSTFSYALNRSRSRQWLIDGLVLAAFVALAAGVVFLVRDMTAPAADVGPTVSTDPANLPYYAARSLLRMFVALGLSLAFTFLVGTWAARSRRAEKVLLPAIDILQSVPVLGFLTVITPFFMAVFPGSTMGLEFAAIFAVFTGQVWNITLAFYQSLITQPRDLDEAARSLRLGRWRRFWRLDVPGSMSPLVWNGMMSFGGGWFFLANSEAITTAGHTYALPGVGSYVATAVREAQTGRLVPAIALMAVMVVGVNLLFWRPLTAWAERFRVEESDPAHKHRSVVLNVLRDSTVPVAAGRMLRPAGRGLDCAGGLLGRTGSGRAETPNQRLVRDVLLVVAGVLAVVWIADRAIVYLHESGALHYLPTVIGMGLVTLGRVLVVVAAATLVFVPLGVWIGMNPRVARLAQPVVQVLASFPANFLYPFFIGLFAAGGIGLGWGAIALMALGSGWYILFNVIAGASAIPTDLREMSADLGLGRAARWRSLILPAIVPTLITGVLTAAGGAWNASIVAEFVPYGHQTLTTTGLGAYIAQAANDPDGAPRVLLGVIVMSAFVVVLNRLVWHRLYRRAQSRFSL